MKEFGLECCPPPPVAWEDCVCVCVCACVRVCVCVCVCACACACVCFAVTQKQDVWALGDTRGHCVGVCQCVFVCLQCQDSVCFVCLPADVCVCLWCCTCSVCTIGCESGRGFGLLLILCNGHSLVQEKIGSVIISHCNISYVTVSSSAPTRLIGFQAINKQAFFSPKNWFDTFLISSLQSRCHHESIHDLSRLVFVPPSRQAANFVSGASSEASSSLLSRSAKCDNSSTLVTLDIIIDRRWHTVYNHQFLLGRCRGGRWNEAAVFHSYRRCFSHLDVWLSGQKAQRMSAGGQLGHWGAQRL